MDWVIPSNWNRVTLVFGLMIGLSSCLVDVQYYRHGPTHAYRKHVDEQGLQQIQRFSDSGVFFVPHLVEMGPTYPSPRSFLVLYSRTETSVFIEKVILLNESSSFKKELLVRQDVSISQEMHDSPILRGFVPLFTDKNTTPDEVPTAKQLILEVYYHLGEEGETLKVMRFELDLVDVKEIAWAT